MSNFILSEEQMPDQGLRVELLDENFGNKIYFKGYFLSDTSVGKLWITNRGVLYNIKYWKHL